jgi:PTS system glucose-specific IIC component
MTATADERGRGAVIVAALGGAGNVVSLDAVAHTRLRAELRDAARVDDGALAAAGVAGVQRVGATVLHLVVGDRAAALAADQVRRSDRPGAPMGAAS